MSALTALAPLDEPVASLITEAIALVDPDAEELADPAVSLIAPALAVALELIDPPTTRVVSAEEVRPPVEVEVAAAAFVKVTDPIALEDPPTEPDTTVPLSPAPATLETPVDWPLTCLKTEADTSELALAPVVALASLVSMVEADAPPVAKEVPEAKREVLALDPNSPCAEVLAVA